MGHQARLHAAGDGLTEHDLAQLVMDGLAPPQGCEAAPIHGMVRRHGQIGPYSLDIWQIASPPRGIVIEQVAIVALVILSFLGPAYHLIA